MSSRLTSGTAAIVGVSQTRIERRSIRSLGAVAVEAARAAIADAGLLPHEIDGYIGAPYARDAAAMHADGIDEISAGYLTAALALENAAWVLDIDDLAAGLVVAASHALAAGTCRYVLALRALYNPPGRAYSRSESRLAAGPEQFTLPHGIGPGGGRFAQWLQRYMHDYGATREALYEVAKLGREHAQANPLAVWHGAPPLTVDDYLASRWISEPMCLFDADMPVTGAVAFVLTTAERARDLPQQPAYVIGYANAANTGRLLPTCGLTTADIQVAQLYDGYSPMVWCWLERLGFCDRGQAHAFARGGRIRAGGELPLNTFGGALGEGRLHGAGHLREAVLQATGRAAARQVADVRRSLVQVGTPERSWTLVLGADPP